MRNVAFFLRGVVISATLAGGVAGGFAAQAKEAPLEVQAEKYEKRQALAHTMANLVISILRDQKKSDTDRKYSLEQGFANVVDIDWIAKFVLGYNWRNATEEQRQVYTKLYRQYLTKVYVENYAESSDRRISDIKVLGISDGEDGNYMSHTEILLTDGHNMKVDYMVSERENSNKIVDVVIEGVSLLSTHRSDFSALAANKGVDGVIARLQQLVSEPGRINLSMN